MRNGVERRKKAIERLESQLKVGVKPEFIKEGKKKTEVKTVVSKDGLKITTRNMIPLSDTDRERIKKEIETLKSRV